MGFKLKLYFLLVIVSVGYSVSDKICRVTQKHWDDYKFEFNKSYSSAEAESTARLTYAANLLRIRVHNAAYKNGSVSYQIAPNQFTDMTFDTVQAKFPQNFARFRQPCEYGPYLFYGHRFSEDFEYSEQIYKRKVHDQGLKCNSGWAYATATMLEIFQAKQNSTAVKTVSAQFLIDCAGSENACFNESPFMASKFFYQTRSPIYDEVDYPNTPLTGRGQCKIPKNTSNKSLNSVWLGEVCDADFRNLEVYVKKNSPVVFEFNQMSFEFIHYHRGIFTPPEKPILGTHYMAIVGFGRDSNDNEYWKLQNSFGSNWGEGGYIRLSKNNWKPYSGHALMSIALVTPSYITLGLKLMLSK